MPSNHLILCHPPFLLPSILPSIRVFPNESTLHIRWPKYWSFSFSISPFNECSGLISFRIDWSDLLAVKGLSWVFSSTTVSKHQFFITQPSLGSNSDIHIWLLETTRLWTFVNEVIMLYRFAIAFLPKSKSLNFMAAVTVCSDFGTQENEVCHFTLKRKQKGHTKIQMLGSELGLLTSSDHH